MRVAALYDIHGNLPALEAVLKDVREAEVDQIVVGGDVVSGPMPRETLRLLRDLDIPVQFIQGNADAEVIAQMAGIETSNVPEQFREVVRWVAQQLQAEDEELMRSWPLTLHMQISGLGDVLFCHATPRNNTEIFTPLTPEDRLLKVFEGLDDTVVVCGHTHMQFDRMIGKTHVLNGGSVGMPYAEPGAYWLLLRRDIQFRHTLYDFTQAAELIRNTNYPMAKDFAANNVLHPPSEGEVLEAFTKAQL